MATESDILESGGGGGGGGGGGTLILHGKRKAPASRNLQDEEEEEEEEERGVEELEREIAELGRRILDSRRTLPERILRTLSARFHALRPPPPPRRHALEDGATAEVQSSSELCEGNLLVEADLRKLERLQTFRANIASNISSMPEVLKRTNECIEKIEKLEQHNVVIHHVFKMNRT